MRVLIVKLSSLGDVVHTLPVVSDIAAAHPGIHIDWAVEPAFVPLLERASGVAERIEIAQRRWTRDGWLSRPSRSGIAEAWRRLRRERYDAVLDLQGLTKSALVAALARGPSWAFANRTDGSSYEWPTRSLATHAVRVEPHSHAVDRGRALARLALGTADDAPPVFGLVAANQMAPEPDRIVLVHGTSRADKLWPEANWIAFARRLLASGRRLALPQADEAERQRADRIVAAVRAGGAVADPDACTVWPAMALGALIDRMAACGGVVGVDSGPSHVAVALDLPHVQIYNHPTAWRTGPQARHGHRHQVSVQGEPTPSVDAAWAAWEAVSDAAASSPPSS